MALPSFLPSSPGYRRLVRASAWYDLAATAAFATPWSFALLHGAMNDAALAIGAAPLPAFAPVHLLFANLLGSVVIVWAALRLWATRPEHGLFDGIARVLFAVWQAVALAAGASVLIAPFLVAEIAFGVAQLVPIAVAWIAARQSRGERHSATPSSATKASR